MKILKVILLLYLICKSSLLPAMDFVGFRYDSCHLDQIELASQDHAPDDHNDEKGCCNSCCDCLCCGHIFTLDAMTELFFSESPIVKTSLSNYYFAYAHAFNKGVWQPPRLS